jgi:hypothetical protein
MSHKPVIVTSEDGKLFAARCARHFSGPGRSQRWEAEDDLRKHAEQVQRALANLRRGRGSLFTERNHARTMMEDPNISEHDRETWRIIFEGADHRLNDTTAVEQDGLF